MKHYRRATLLALALAMLVTACGDDDAVTTTTPTTVAPVTATGPLAAAERLVDAVYSDDVGELADQLANTTDGSDTDVPYLQGFLQGVNAELLERSCEPTSVAITIRCFATGADDVTRTLGLPSLTDEWVLTVVDDSVTRARFFLSDDPLVVSAVDWVEANHPELFEQGGPCFRWFNGGTTPSECGTAFATATNGFVQSVGS